MLRGLKVVPPHINVLECVVLDEVLVAALWVRARTRNLGGAESVKGPHRLDCISRDLHRIRLA